MTDGRGSQPPRFGAILRRRRVAAGLTQEALAERSGLSVDAISTLESGRRLRPHSSTVEMLADALGVGGKEREEFVAAARVLRPTARRSIPPSDLTSLPTDALPERAPLPAGSRMPLAPNPLFVGRGEELLQIAAALRGSNTTVALGQVVASTGLGGLGKTQLAVEFVHRYGCYFAGGVFWLSFATADEVTLQVAACAEPGLAPLPLEERVRRVKDAWQSAVPRLLVFDNCEDETLLDAWRPPSGGCRVLVTSRRSQWSPTLGVAALPLDVLPRSDSIELLRRYRPDLPPDDSRLDAIADELGDLPLAMHLAGSYLSTYRTEVSLGDYQAELRRSEFVQHASLFGAGLDDSISPTHHVQGLAQTFALCLGRLDRERDMDRVAIALLARMACMAPGQPVPRDLLGRTLDDIDPLLRADGMRRLSAVGLLEIGEGWLRLHRLLAHFVRQQVLDPDAQSAVVRALIACGEDADHSHLTGSALESVIPHLVDVAGASVSGTGEERLAAEICIAAGSALYAAGHLGPAGLWYERAQTISEKTLGTDHPVTALVLNQLGVLLDAQGDFAAARSLKERALEIRERVLGPDHPDTAESLNNVASLLRVQGEVAAARPLLERALEIRERVLGPDHPDTAQSLNNLAVLLRNVGEVAAARSLLERALDIWERILGPNHSHTAQSLNNLAVLLRNAGEVAAAKDLVKRALDIWERVLGPNHPLTAWGLNNLGVLLREQGEMDAARPLFERAVDIWNRLLGSDHPDATFSLHNLALLHRAQGDPAAARPLFERALAIRERALGPDHPDTVATRRALEELAAEGKG